MDFKITKGRVEKAQKVVLYGVEGIGKTCFAADFPNPLFIDTEGGSTAYDVARLPAPQTWTMLAEEIKWVGETLPCDTLVIDTIDWAEKLCIEHILKTSDKPSIESFGYGKGFTYVYEEMGRLLAALTKISERGVNIVLTAHAMMYKFEEPNEQGNYDRYTLKLTNKTGNKVGAMVKEWASMVLFANYKTLVVTDTKTNKSKASGGERVMYTTHHPNWDAKNRDDLPEILPLKFEAIKAYIPANLVKREQPKAELEGKTALQKAEKVFNPSKVELIEEEEAILVTPNANDCFAKLNELMVKNEVHEGEIRKIVAQKGYYPEQTPIEKYDKEFIEGVLVGAWEQVYQGVLSNRAEAPF